VTVAWFSTLVCTLGLSSYVLQGLRGRLDRLRQRRWANRKGTKMPRTKMPRISLRRASAHPVDFRARKYAKKELRHARMQQCISSLCLSALLLLHSRALANFCARVFLWYRNVNRPSPQGVKAPSHSGLQLAHAVFCTRISSAVCCPYGQCVGRHIGNSGRRLRNSGRRTKKILGDALCRLSLCRPKLFGQVSRRNQQQGCSNGGERMEGVRGWSLITQEGSECVPTCCNPQM
jgi:hypothetical protein